MKYRKKPVVIEAIEFGGSSTHAECIKSWMETGIYSTPIIVTCDLTIIEIPTLEGIMIAQPGDFIIRGIKGEFYPCKPDVFNSTYEKVEE